MSRTLHAFKSYRIIENDLLEEIQYIDDKDYDIAYGNWRYIHKLIDYGNYLGHTDIYIPCYDFLDDARLVKKEEMKLVEPKLFEDMLKLVIEEIKKIPNNENLLIQDEEYLYEEDGAIITQKEKLLYYADKLLRWAQEGLYFAIEAE